MDLRTIEILEYPKIVAQLREHCSSAMGQAIIDRMRPMQDFQIIAARISETSEARFLLQEHVGISARGLHDIADSVTRAAKIGVLNAAELLNIADTAACCRRMRHGIINANEKCPRIREQAKLISDFSPLEKAISSAIAPSGEINDSASSELARARRRTRALHGEIQQQLQQLIHSAHTSDMLQEAIITQRNGRFCVPVRAESRNAFKGIVHDLSASGQTAFMEPLSVMQLGNDLREAERLQEEEEQRVLAQLSGMVAQVANALLQSADAAARLDAIFARASYARALNATEPELNRQGAILLQQARHPLLGSTAVPIDIELGNDNNNSLLITGPNTGGKTVTLKTIGLLTLMAQSGLHLPAAPGASVAVFDAIYADIGDEQSIEQSLSTFSGHIRNIITIMNEAPANSLVLLDEIGAGTDPAEGAALAKAILLELHERGCRTVATTHYGELKIFGQNSDGFRNAGVEFDMLTLRPTYRLLYDLPGSSNALAIAQRLGLPKQLVKRAREQLPESPQAMEHVLKQAEGVRRAFDRERSLASKARKEAEALVKSVQEKEQRLEKQRDEILARARKKAEEVLDKTRIESNQLLDELREAVRENRNSGQHSTAQLPRVAEVRKKAREKMSGVEEALAELPIIENAVAASTTAKELPALTQVAAGQAVFVQKLGHRGIALTAASGDEEVEVQVGIMRVRVAVSELRARVETNYTPPAPAGAKYTAMVEKEIKLLGKRAEEAAEELDDYLFAASEGGLATVRIVHGFGTGALRQIVQELLRHHPAVKSFRSGETGEGGGGVIIAELEKR